MRGAQAADLLLSSSIIPIAQKCRSDGSYTTGFQAPMTTHAEGFPVSAFIVSAAVATDLTVVASHTFFCSVENQLAAHLEPRKCAFITGSADGLGLAAVRRTPSPRRWSSPTSCFTKRPRDLLMVSAAPIGSATARETFIHSGVGTGSIGSDMRPKI